MDDISVFDLSVDDLSVDDLFVDDLSGLSDEWIFTTSYEIVQRVTLSFLLKSQLFRWDVEKRRSWPRIGSLRKLRVHPHHCSMRLPGSLVGVPNGMHEAYIGKTEANRVLYLAIHILLPVLSSPCVDWYYFGASSYSLVPVFFPPSRRFFRLVSLCCVTA